MKTNDFIKEHIKIDERQKISKKLSLLSKKYSEFGYYLDLIQKEAVGKIFVHILFNQYLVKGMISEDLTNNTFRHYINTLLANEFIETFRPTSDIYDQIEEKYNNYIANVANYYRLTTKGKDFLNIDIIKEYLNKEYEEYRNGIL